MGSTYLEWAEYNSLWPYVGRVTDNCGAKSREVVLSECGKPTKSLLPIWPFHRPYPFRLADNLRFARDSGLRHRNAADL
jgi:hypothetical protein